MSETPAQPEELPGELPEELPGELPEELPEDRLEAALLKFTTCIGVALPDVCSYGLTFGSQYVPFDPDPDEDCTEEDIMCSQAWVRVTDVNPVGGVDAWGGDCGGSLSLGLEVGVMRCYDVPDGGEAPTATDVMVAAMQSMADMRDIHCAALNCDAWDTIRAMNWNPVGPLGGQYGGTWTFTVEF